MSDMPKEIWAGFDQGYSMWFREPDLMDDKMPSNKYIRADLVPNEEALKRKDEAIKYALMWFSKAINGDIMTAPDAGIVRRKLSEALSGGEV